MKARVLEAVPNFSEGRNLEVIGAIANAMRGAGADVLHWTADPDHNRSVVTVAGAPDVVEEAAVAAARIAADRIDMRHHKGLHPRIGALDVMPLVPLLGVTMAEARASAHRVGQRIAQEVGVPVYFYAAASSPPGRQLAELRRDGFERLLEGWPVDREPDALPASWPYPGAHPTAGAACVGARPVLLAWNVFVRDVAFDELKAIARTIRESGGGIRGLRALALQLPGQGGMQLSMNLENVNDASPMGVFRRIEAAIATAGGSVVRTEVIGLVPDRLAVEAAADRLGLGRDAEERLLSRRLLEHLAG